MSGIRWPVASKYDISQPFGHPAHPWEPKMYLQRDATGEWRKCRVNSFGSGVRYEDVHPGVDIVCPTGTRVNAVADGKIVGAGVYSQTGEKYVMLRIHRDETSQTIAFYTHLARVVVQVGQRVTRASRIALSGNSGWSTGPHLHFEIRTGPADMDAWTSTASGLWFRWNPERCRVGGDLADQKFLE